MTAVNRPALNFISGQRPYLAWPPRRPALADFSRKDGSGDAPKPAREARTLPRRVVAGIADPGSLLTTVPALERAKPSMFNGSALTAPWTATFRLVTPL